MTDDGGPAFPEEENHCSGMTLRDWFAGQALNGITGLKEIAGLEEMKDVRVIAHWAYRFADAMLAERKRK